jgi:hypothetical protein
MGHVPFAAPAAIEKVGGEAQGQEAGARRRAAVAGTNCYRQLSERAL